jgi:hypothetical protein
MGRAAWRKAMGRGFARGEPPEGRIYSEAGRERKTLEPLGPSLYEGSRKTDGRGPLIWH